MPRGLTSWLAGSSADVRAFSGRTLVITLLRALFFAIGHHQLNRRRETHGTTAIISLENL